MGPWAARRKPSSGTTSQRQATDLIEHRGQPGPHQLSGRLRFPTDLTLAGPLNWHQNLGLLYHRNGAEDTLRDALGNESGSFEVSQLVLFENSATATAAHSVSVGASYKSLNEVIDNEDRLGLGP